MKLDTNLAEFLADLTVFAVVVGFFIAVIIGVFCFFKFIVGMKVAVILLGLIAGILIGSAFLKGSSKNSKK